MTYERQLAEKAGQVEDALRRIGQLDGFEVEPIEAAPEQWRYRNKLEYSFGAGGEAGVALGFHRRGSWSEVVDVDDCMLASEANNAARNEVRDWAHTRELFDRTTAATQHGRCCATWSSARAGAPARSRPASSPRRRDLPSRRSTSTP